MTFANARDVWVLYVQELRSALRERNIVVYSVLLPLLLYPVLMWLIFSAITFVQGQTEGFVSRVVVNGLPAEHEGLKRLLVEDAKVQLLELGDEPAETALREGRVDVVATFTAEAPASGMLEPNFRVDFVYDSSKDRSEAARARVVDHLDKYRAEWLARDGARLGVSPVEWLQFAVTSVNTASQRDVGAFVLKILLPALLIVMVALGCFYPAIDTTAGERERATWETTMTLAVSRSSVVTAKYLYVATLGVVAGLLNIAAMVLTMGPVFSALGAGASERFSFQIPLVAIPVVALGAVLVALFIAAGMMIFAAFARTFREGQSMVSPFYFMTMLPVMFLQSPDVEFTPQLAFVPVVNVALMFRDAIGGVFQWPLILVTVLIEVATILACLGIARRILTFEDVLMGSYNGSFFKFIRERWLRKGNR
jgi:sodium transport system permease protein